ncbi:MAG: GDP-mannose 4,6-dehydratase [Mycobacteriales bacterium]|nr:GDP-mannose 4,6-dehydratase [Mycobacteriales bacterium]
MTRALITGISGQDGTYLAELLAARGYEVSGLVRRTYAPENDVVRHLVPGVRLLEGNLCDTRSLIGVLDAVQPDEVYNLAAFSEVGRSWEQAELAGDVSGLGVLRLLDALRVHTSGEMARVRVYQASSSEMFGLARETPQTEMTAFHPRSPYGTAKAFAHHTAVNYRESYGAFTACGILYNHESPRRRPNFVTRKISLGVAAISLGQADHLTLGNLDVRRDWGHAADYVDAMWRMLQHDEPGDYVIATGTTHSLRELLSCAFACIGVDDWTPHVRQDPSLLRPADVSVLTGDPTKAREVLGWTPTRDFDAIVREMVEHDVAYLRRTADLG